MNRNPLIPFLLICILGIGLMFILSFKGLGDAKDLAKEKEGGGKEKTEQTASANPEEIYQQSCVSCHGDQYQGGAGPALKGVGERLSEAEVKTTIQNGRGAMPAGLVEDENLDAMAKFVHGLK
ncbi:cytochrome c [Peribacillus cavernae]|uniref:Cytochrome c n=1 Tax=Peribacillus cavernae TaxID=1674310 RepID=A0A433HJ21_9BACI|nr:cytochrome c [Peribacillus cavernae]MDQ0218279.1 cytochrome c550 [Peribacillus cavernae]RUQ28436.1 cytochrome c [Peribacillus cavernae]